MGTGLNYLTIQSSWWWLNVLSFCTTGAYSEAVQSISHNYTFLCNQFGYYTTMYVYVSQLIFDLLTFRPYSVCVSCFHLAFNISYVFNAIILDFISLQWKLWIVKLIVLVEWLTLLLRVWDVPGSNLWRRSDILIEVSHGLPQSFEVDPGIMSWNRPRLLFHH
jgi:hypothetical protein